MTSCLYHEIHIMGFDPKGPGLCKGPSLEGLQLQRTSGEQTAPPNHNKTCITNSTLKVAQFVGYPGSQLTMQVLPMARTIHGRLEPMISLILHRYP